jgi:hypothetical protein
MEKKYYSAPVMEIISTFSNESLANAVVDGQATMLGHTSKGTIVFDKEGDWSDGSDNPDAKGHPQWGNLWNF